MISCAQCCIYFLVISTIPIYVFLGLFWHSINSHWSHLPYYGFGVFNCFLLLVAAWAKHRKVLFLYLISEGVRVILQATVAFFSIKRAIIFDHDEVEKSFGIEGFYRTLHINSSPKTEAQVIDHIDRWTQYTFISFALFAFMDILGTGARMALGHSIRKSIKS